MIPHFLEKLGVAITVLKGEALHNVEECTRCSKTIPQNKYYIIRVLTLKNINTGTIAN